LRKTQILSSKSEARRAMAENSISINKTKIAQDFKCTAADLINNKYLLVQKGKKNYYIVICE
jgi:tyrosyl-tRNA synthetase